MSDIRVIRFPVKYAVRIVCGSLFCGKPIAAEEVRQQLVASCRTHRYDEAWKRTPKEFTLRCPECGWRGTITMDRRQCYCWACMRSLSRLYQEFRETLAAQGKQIDTDQPAWLGCVCGAWYKVTMPARSLMIDDMREDPPDECQPPLGELVAEKWEW